MSATPSEALGFADALDPNAPWNRKGAVMELPDLEVVSAKVHEAWMDSKRAKCVTTRLSENGEELMVPYAELSEAAKDLDRQTVKAVYAAIQTACASRNGKP